MELILNQITIHLQKYNQYTFSHAGILSLPCDQAFFSHNIDHKINQYQLRANHISNNVLESCFYSCISL